MKESTTENLIETPKVLKKDQGTDASTCEERIASLLAVHLVSHILDEAYIVANAAEESGQPWRYLSILRNLKNCKNANNTTDLSLESKPELTVENAKELVCSLATSTPQKVSDDICVKGNTSNEVGYCEDFESPQSQLSKATSMFFNNLFDMSEVEKDSFSTADITSPHPGTSNTISDSISNILYSYIDAAFGMSNLDNDRSFVELTGDFDDYTETKAEKDSGSPRVDEAFNVTDDDKNVNMLEKVKAVVATAENLSKEFANRVKELKLNSTLSKETYFDSREVLNGCGDGASTGNVEKSILDKKSFEEENVVDEPANDDPYEHGYLTFNRDSEPTIDDQNKVLKLDCKGDMFEVNLLDETGGEGIATQEEDFRPHPLSLGSRTFASSSGCKKSSLSHRFRSSGSRLLTCLRKWWRKKNPGKFKEELRINDDPLSSPSPGYHNRSATLQERREFPTPSTSYWKFNTINESVLSKNSQWDRFK